METTKRDKILLSTTQQLGLGMSWQSKRSNLKLFLNRKYQNARKYNSKKF